MFGGNSNWRGPVWVPINVMLIRGLLNLYEYYGDEFTVECPTGSGQHKNLYQVADDISERLIGAFRRDADGRRPVHGGVEMLQTDPHWRDLVLFYEYLPRRQRRRDRRQPPDRLDRARWGCCRCSSGATGRLNRAGGYPRRARRARSRSGRRRRRDDRVAR